MTQPCRLLVLALLIALLLPLPARAAVNCSITTVGVAFGSYNVYSATTLTSTGSVRFVCSGVGGGGRTVTVRLSRGSAGSYSPRKMFRSAEALTYNLYLNAGGTQIFGDGTGGSVQLSTTIFSNQAVTTTIFGRIPPGQDVSVGNYTDTIIATINF